MKTRYLNKILSAAKVDEATLNEFGNEGWCLTASSGDRLFMVKIVHEEEKKDEGHLCCHCESFPEKSLNVVAKCSRWGIMVQGSCGEACETFKTRLVKMEEKEIPGAMNPPPPGVIPDDLSAWHWQPRTEMGEKRVEAITSQESGVRTLSHKHRVVAIVSKDGKVVRGKTDMIDGHFHPVTLIGMADEADGHTHAFIVPAKIE